MVSRAIRQVIKTRKQLEGGGFPVRRPPFDNLGGLILLHDHMGPYEIEPGKDFPSPDHPHRGFSTVSYLLQGALQHHCSSGHSAVNYPGDAQWMIAGRGVVHGGNSEEEFRRTGGTVEGFQIWINLPARLKMIPPNYSEIPAASLPVVRDELSSVRIIAGSHAGKGAAISPLIPVSMMDVRLRAGGKVTIDVPRGQVGTAYVFRGAGRFGNDTVLSEGVVGILGEGDKLEITTDEDAAEAAVAALLVFGEPIAEPVARAGPFVMNTRAELMQAFEDYQSGKMGRESRIKHVERDEL
ncbi:Pirin-related protein [Hyaloraphidium curvatum]|nr:Pirin-related protein [Hyaloraphidium curvatum]